MVLSTRRAVLLVALVGVLALGIMGALRAVSASPDNADKHNGSEGRSTLTLLAKTPEIKVQSRRPGTTRPQPWRSACHQRPALRRERKGESRAPRRVLHRNRPRR